MGKSFKEWLEIEQDTEAAPFIIPQDNSNYAIRAWNYKEKIEDKLIDMLVNEGGACPECIDAKLEGFTICGDCSV